MTSKEIRNAKMTEEIHRILRDDMGLGEGVPEPYTGNEQDSNDFILYCEGKGQFEERFRKFLPKAR